MTQDLDRVALFLGASQANGTMPLPLAWQQAFDGEISVEEAARQREGIDSPDQVELYRRLCRPIDELEYQRFQERFLPRRRGRVRYLCILSGVAAAAAAFCLLPMPGGEWNRGVVVANADPLPTFTFEVRSRLAETRGGDRRDSLRVGLDEPVLWTITPGREYGRIAGARLALYARVGGDLIAIEGAHVTRSKQGSFTVTAPRLRTLLAERAVGPATLWAVVALEGAPIAEPGPDGQCASTDDVRCMAVDVVLE